MGDTVVDAVDKLRVFAVIGLGLSHLKDAVRTARNARCVLNNAGGVAVHDRLLCAVGVAQNSLLCIA